MSLTPDPLNGWTLPASAAEWTTLLAGTGIANPTQLWLCQEASGGLNDSIGTDGLVAHGTGIAYQQAVAGWTRKGVTLTAGAGNYFVANAGGLTTGATPCQLLVFAAVTPSPDSAAAVAAATAYVADSVAYQNDLTTYADLHGDAAYFDILAGTVDFSDSVRRAADLAAAAACVAAYNALFPALAPAKALVAADLATMLAAYHQIASIGDANGYQIRATPSATGIAPALGCGTGQLFVEQYGIDASGVRPWLFSTSGAGGVAVLEVYGTPGNAACGSVNVACTSVTSQTQIGDIAYSPPMTVLYACQWSSGSLSYNDRRRMLRRMWGGWPNAATTTTYASPV